MTREQEVHILIGCADARDLNQTQVEAVSAGIKRYAEKGIDIVNLIPIFHSELRKDEFDIPII